MSNVKFYLDNTVQDSIFNLTKTFKKGGSTKGTEKVQKSNSKSKSNLSFLRLGDLDIQNINVKYLLKSFKKIIAD